MLKELRLENYRRFERHVVPFRERTVIVGKNNAGKSTIVEAVRLASLVANRYRSLNFSAPPAWLDGPVGNRGVTPSLRDLNADLSSVFHALNGPPSVVTCEFDSGEDINIYVGPDEAVFAVVRDKDGRLVTSKAQAQHLGIERVAVQPQVGPVLRNERRLDPQTIVRGLDSPLAPQHFRNQLHHLGPEIFGRFKDLSEATWPSLQVRELLVPDYGDDEPLRLFIRDGKHVAELAAMGHGMQMWLQVMWFLARNSSAQTVVLDEPDVYLHADLQRRLVRLLRRGSQQVVLATHSVEMMSEVDPEEVLIVTSDLPRSRWAAGEKGVQHAIDHIGGVHNIQLSRLAHARRALFVEGEDIALLRPMADALVPEAESIETLPRLEIGGWSGWPRVIGVAQFLRNAAGDQVTPYCLLDSDYFHPGVVVGRLEQATVNGIQLLVLSRKEIENYLLVPAAIGRIVARGMRRKPPVDLISQIEGAITRICDELRDEAHEDLTTESQKGERGVTAGQASRFATAYMRKRLAETDGQLSVIGGKSALSSLSKWTSEQFGVGLRAPRIAAELRREEIHEDLRDFLECVVYGRELPDRHLSLWRERCDYAPLKNSKGGDK